MLSYVQVIGFEGFKTSFDKSAAPMSDLANIAGVGFFGILISLGSMVSFFACTLASINAGSRIFFAMARHGLFHNSVGRAHNTHETPHVAVTITALVTFLAPASISMFGIEVLDSYAYFGTIATYGFLVAYILISIAAPFYLAREHQLRPIDLVISVIAIAFMAIPVLGSFGIPGKNSLFPVPSAPYNVFPYLFLLYLVVGGGWFLILRLGNPEILQHMEEDIEASHTRFSDLRKV